MTEQQKNKVVIFDFDGILFETDIYHFIAWKKVLQRESFYIDKKYIEILKGLSRVEQLMLLEKKLDLKLDQEKREKLLKMHEKQFEVLSINLTKRDVAPCIIETIKELKKKGYKISIISKTKYAINILQETELMDIFDYVPSKSVITELSAMEHSTEEFLIHVINSLGAKQYETFLVTNSQNIVNISSEMMIRTISVSNNESIEGSLFNFKWIIDLTPEAFLKVIENN